MLARMHNCPFEITRSSEFRNIRLTAAWFFLSAERNIHVGQERSNSRKTGSLNEMMRFYHPRFTLFRVLKANSPFPSCVIVRGPIRLDGRIEPLNNKDVFVHGTNSRTQREGRADHIQFHDTRIRFEPIRDLVFGDERRPVGRERLEKSNQSSISATISKDDHGFKLALTKYGK